MSALNQRQEGLRDPGFCGERAEATRKGPQRGARGITRSVHVINILHSLTNSSISDVREVHLLGLGRSQHLGDDAALDAR